MVEGKAKDFQLNTQDAWCFGRVVFRWGDIILHSKT